MTSILSCLCRSHTHHPTCHHQPVHTLWHITVVSFLTMNTFSHTHTHTHTHTAHRRCQSGIYDVHPNSHIPTLSDISINPALSRINIKHTHNTHNALFGCVSMVTENGTGELLTTAVESKCELLTTLGVCVCVCRSHRQKLTLLREMLAGCGAGTCQVSVNTHTHTHTHTSQ